MSKTSMINDSYDVVVVGGGPGGTSTAKHLALLGHSVLVLEKRQEIGAPKRCGEGLSVATAEMIGEIPQNCIAQKIDGCKVYSPDKRCVLIDFGVKSTGYVVERKVFDKWLAYEASRAGATIIAKSEVTDVLKKGQQIVGVKARICGSPEIDIHAKVVVAADGIESTIARKAGLDTTNKLVNVDSGFQYEMANLKLDDYKKIYLFFGNDVAPRGYVWIFPKGPDVANVGIGTALAEKSAKEYLDKFIRENPEIFGKASIIEVNSGGIPVGGFLDNMVLDGFIAVGDAAHQVNPIHGGGMKEATVAGEIAAKVISGSVKAGNVSEESLSEYNKLWWDDRGKKLKKVERLRQVVEKLSDNDLNMLAKALTGDVLIELSRGNKLTTLAKVMMRNPRLIKLARHLL
jgi:digeranylgeranylglycerophospholipid reductase